MSYSQNFDGVTAPAIPSGMTTTGFGWQTTTGADGIMPTSAPNCAIVTTASGLAYTLTSSSPDSSGGDVSVSADVNAYSTGNPGYVGVVARGSAAVLNSFSSYYAARINYNLGLPEIIKVISGTLTSLDSLSSMLNTISGWSTPTLSISGSSLSMTVQDKATGQYYTPSGALQSSPVACLTATDSSITGSGYFGCYAQEISGPIDAFFDNVSQAGLTAPTFVYASDGVAVTESACSIGFIGDSGTTTTSLRLIPMGGDSAIVSPGILSTWRTRGDAGSSADGVLAAAFAGESAASASATISTTMAGGFAYASDGGAGYDSAAIVGLLAGDVSVDAEAFATSLIIVAADGGLGDDSASLSTLTASVSYTAVDPTYGTESAPAPTAWDTDDAAGVSGWFALSIGGDGGYGGTGGTTDLGVGAEAWHSASVLVACDAGIPGDSAAFWSSLILAVDGATAAELAAVGLVTEGYHIYMSPGVNQPIDYTTVVSTVLGFENTTWTSGPLAVPGTWGFGVRAYDDAGEEQNLSASVFVTFDAAGHDISNMPPAPVGLRAFATKGAGIRVEWAPGATSIAAKRPTGFHVYLTAGSTLSYATPAATVAANTSIQGAFHANLTGIDGVSYTVGVRAYNSSGEEQNTVTRSVTADGSGPLPISSLASVAIP